MQEQLSFGLCVTSIFFNTPFDTTYVNTAPIDEALILDNGEGRDETIALSQRFFPRLGRGFVPSHRFLEGRNMSQTSVCPSAHEL